MRRIFFILVVLLALFFSNVLTSKYVYSGYCDCWPSVNSTQNCGCLACAYDPAVDDYTCDYSNINNCCRLCVDANPSLQCTGPSLTPKPNYYEYQSCPDGQALSCGTVAEAGSQNKKFCGYKITCNKYYWPSAFNQPEPCNVNNVASTTCTYNCSCCPIGQYRSCTLGASYTNTVSLYVGGGDDPVDGVYNQMLKDTCYRDGVKRRNDIVVSITLKRSYTKKDNTEWQDWEQSCRVQNCSCKAPPTPTLTPQNKKRPADGFAKRISGWESPHPLIRLSA